MSEKGRNIVIEVDKLFLALRDNGTSVGLIEALGQVRDDAQQVASRLGEGNVGEITRLIEIDIIKPLEEILDMFQRPCAPDAHANTACPLRPFGHALGVVRAASPW